MLPPSPRSARTFPARFAKAQLTLVEHSLCPLDLSAALQPHLIHRVTFDYTDRNKHAKSAAVAVTCPQGLSPADEFVLWGLLSLALSQPDPQPEFYATPHYCLRMLGILRPSSPKGGKTYHNFREAIRRLARVTYENEAFYDPIRGEHRDVTFGFLKYSLPVDADSPRTWRFYWDQQFFEFCLASRSTLQFDLATYRQLDFASRRLFLLLQKVFWRSSHSPHFNLRKLAVNTLGFSPALETTRLIDKVLRCTQVLLDQEIIVLPLGVEKPRQLLTKLGAGRYSICFQRGPYFDHGHAARQTVIESPLADPLRSIGFDDGTIARLLDRYPHRILAEWADITLAARERLKADFFKKSPAAYFLDSVKAAAVGKRTAPDWWRELRRAEERQRAEQRREAQQYQSHSTSDADFDSYLASEAREAFESVMQSLFAALRAQGIDEPQARDQARHIARSNLRARFHHDHPESRPSPSADDNSLLY